MCYALLMSEPAPICEPPSHRVEQIVAATRTLFLRYGYRRTSVDDIAREAGVAKATLYLHFAGKEDMFRTMIGRFRVMVNERCDAAEGLDAAIAVRLIALLYANYGTALEWFGDAAHLGELKAFASEHPIGPFDDSAPAFRDRLTRVLQEAVERGEISLDMQGLSVAAVVQTLIFAARGAKLASRSGGAGLHEPVKTLVHVIVAGLTP